MRNCSAIETNEVDIKMKDDTLWCLLKSLSPTLSLNVPTWAGYNSLIRSERALTTVSMLPVLNGSPTDWTNLYTAMKEADKLRRSILNSGKTIISFDLQLYIKAIRLQLKPDIRDHFVIRMGELHVVFCVLKVLGKLIDGSGLDQAFVEAGKYYQSHAKVVVSSSEHETDFCQFECSLVESYNIVTEANLTIYSESSLGCGGT